MAKKEIVGLFILVAGLLIILLGSFFSWEFFFVSLIYCLPIMVIGLIIMLNKKEDEIEQIDYLKLKRRKNENK